MTILSAGRQKQIDTTRIIKIETKWPDELKPSRDLFKSGQFDKAVGFLQIAVKNENRAWVQAILSAELIQGLDAMEKQWEATLAFLAIYNVDPETRFFYLIPLPWDTNTVGTPPDEETKKWLASRNSLLQLLGASWRVSGADRTKAVAVLEELTRDPDSRIAQLATAQLWRTQLLTVRQNDVERWARQIQNLPTKLRPGPLLVLANTQQRLGQMDQAMIHLMKIPILYPEKKSLGAAALFKCGTILENTGANEKAKRIWRELVQKFPDSQFSRLVKQKL